MNNTFIVFDIETINDREAMASDFAKWDVDNYDDYIAKMLEINPKSKSYFAKHVFHKVVCISYFYIKFEPLATKLTSTIEYIKNEDGIEMPDEAQNLSHFWNIFAKCITQEFPTFVTFNGKNFDMPVILLRSMKHFDSFNDTVKKAIHVYNDISDKWENNRPNYLNRYSKYHLDLQHDLDPSWGNYFSLANICAVNDISVKTTAHGDGIEELVKDRKWETINTYCCEDTLATAELLLKYLNFTSEIDPNNIEYIRTKIHDIRIKLGLV